jgi:hypothetical protein
MGQVVRRQVTIAAEQNALIKRRARKLGVSEPELIRLGIQSAAQSSAPSEKDMRMWARELSFIRRRAKLRSPNSKRNWTREDLYADRLRRGPG